MARIRILTSIVLSALPLMACGSAPTSTEDTESTSSAIVGANEECARNSVAEFSVKGAVQGTFAVNTNTLGATVGYWVDANSAYHGFVREPNGTITSLDAPGAGSAAGTGEGTVAYAINLEGTIAGEYEDASEVYHAFVRSAGGSYKTFDVAGAGTQANQGTFATNVNSLGEVAGYTVDSSGVAHSFVRSPSGHVSSFDAPVPTQVGIFVALESGLNDLGVATGYYFDDNDVVHGFVRSADGTLKSFDAPSGTGAGIGAYQGTYGGSINDEGNIAGGVLDANYVYHGFIRLSNGSISEFEAPDAGSVADTATGQGTFATGIDPFGTTAGYVLDSTGNVHGFSRSSSGAFTTIDAAGASTSPGVGTVGEGVSTFGLVPGYYFDAAGLAHGFLYTP